MRVIAATNRDLRAAVRDGRFRADLYHRLSVYPLPIPPLRERRDDLLPLAGRFLELNRARLGLRSLRLAPAAEQALLAYDWPGNVRELEHVIGRAALRAAGALDDRHHIVTLQAADLGLEPPARTAEPLAAAAAAASSAPTLKAATDAAQRACIEHGLAGHGGNWAAAARALGVDASNLHKLARRLGLK